MRGWLNYVFVVGLAIAPIVDAALDSEANNGTIVNALQTSIKNNMLLLKKEVADISYSAYQQGRSSSEDLSDPYTFWFKNHKQYYCSGSSAAESAASSFGCSSGTSLDAKYLEYGHMKATVLLDSLVYSDSVDLAAQDLIRTIINPYPPSKYARIISGNMTPADTKGYVKYMANQTLLDIALNSLNAMYFMRLSGNDLGVGAQANSSIMSVMENEATRRFTGSSGDWFAMINDGGFDLVSTTKESVAMQAFQMWMAYQSYKQNERIELLLTTLLAKTVNNSIAQDAMSVN